MNSSTQRPAAWWSPEGQNPLASAVGLRQRGCLEWGEYKDLLASRVQTMVDDLPEEELESLLERPTLEYLQGSPTPTLGRALLEEWSPARELLSDLRAEVEWPAACPKGSPAARAALRESPSLMEWVDQVLHLAT